MTIDKSTGNSASVWSYKPWWCQPWSILLTGTGLIGGSWALSDRIWVVGLVAVPILIWMGYFLLVYPRLFRQAIEQNSAAASESSLQQTDPRS